MKKTYIAILVLCAVCCTGCGKEESSAETVVQTTAATTEVQTTAATETTTATQTTVDLAAIAEANALPFPFGTWRCLDNGGMIFYFAEDYSGSALSMDTAAGISFQADYDAATGKIDFHNNVMLGNTAGQIFWSGEPAFTIVWEDGNSSVMEFVGEGRVAFYSMNELCDMSLNYFEAVNGYRPDNAEAARGDDGFVAVSMYYTQPVEEPPAEMDPETGEPIVTEPVETVPQEPELCDCYLVSQFGAVGTNSYGEDIDLKNIP